MAIQTQGYIDVIAIGYEWVCPECLHLNQTDCYKEQDICGNCGLEFTLNDPEHCYC